MTKNAKPCYWRVMLLLSVIVLVGCGPDRPPLGDVSGTVTYDGKPLEQGSITFEVSGTRSGAGKIVNGQIVEVTTFEAGDGAPVGEARVAISSLVEKGGVRKAAPESGDAPADTGGIPELQSLIPAKYGNPESSGLTATIEEGDNSLNFELMPK